MSNDYDKGWKDGKRDAWVDNFFEGLGEGCKEVVNWSMKVITCGQWKAKQKELPPSRKDSVIDVMPNNREMRKAERKGGGHE